MLVVQRVKIAFTTIGVDIEGVGMWLKVQPAAFCNAVMLGPGPAVQSLKCSAHNTHGTGNARLW